MDQEKFIKLIKKAVEQPAIDGVISNLRHPPGRQPKQSLVELSTWFNKQNDDDKKKITNIVKTAVNHSIFGFLCILDGVSSIKEANSDFDPILKLTYTDSVSEIVLNDPNEEFLHDIYQSL